MLRSRARLFDRDTAGSRDRAGRLPAAVLWLSAVVSLFAVWLLLSGHYTRFLTVAGLATAVLIAVFAARLGLIDREGQPVHLLGRAVTFLPWLIWEIVKSAWDVTRIVLNPRLPIDPVMIRIRTGQKTTVGQVVYANSITLTPGTVSVEVEGDVILVHALTRAAADGLAEGGMDRRVTAFEGER